MDAQESTESKDPVLFYAALLVGGLSLPPFPFPAAPLGLWGRRKVRTRCGGDGGCTLETLKLDRGSKKVPRSRRKRRERHKTYVILLRSFSITVWM